MASIDPETNERGYTLIEVMIALTVFSLGVLSVSYMQLTSMRGNAASVNRTEASRLAANLAEEIRGMPYHATSQIVTDRVSPIALTGTGGKVFTTSWQVGPETTYTVGANTFTARKVAVTVAWNERGLARNARIGFIKSPAF